MSKITLFTAFGPGRPWLFDIWVNTISRLVFPENTKLVVMDNTNEAGMYTRIQEYCDSSPFDDTIAVRYNHVAQGDGAIIAQHLATIWNIARKYTTDCTDYVLSFEPDVIVGADALTLLLDNLQDPKVLIAGCAIRCRHRSNHIMAYPFKQLDGWHLDTKNTANQNGTRQVGSVNLGFTLIRAKWLANIELTGRINGYKGHDFDLCSQAMHSGGKVVCDYRIGTKHMSTPNAFKCWEGRA